jgi:hypothetical protein
MQNACEPVHIQFNQDDSTVAVINRMHHATGILTAKAEIYDIDSKPVSTFKVNHIGLSDAGVQEVIKLKDILATAKGVSFVVLNLTDAVGKTVSHNVYWLSPDNNFTGFNGMTGTHVQVKVLKAEKGIAENKWTMEFSNNTDKLAFFVRPQLMKNGEEVMPSYWTCNYFTLAPHESTTVSVSAPVAKLGSTQPTVLVEGWNIDKQVIGLPAK